MKIVVEEVAKKLNVTTHNLGSMFIFSGFTGEDSEEMLEDFHGTLRMIGEAENSVQMVKLNGVNVVVYLADTEQSDKYAWLEMTAVCGPHGYKYKDNANLTTWTKSEGLITDDANGISISEIFGNKFHHIVIRNTTTHEVLAHIDSEE